MALEPTYQFSSLTGEKDDASDSIDAIHSGDWGYSVSMVWKKTLDRNSSIHIRPTFRQTGFLLTRDNLQYLDRFHPTFELINDLSQSAPKTALLHHRFKFFGLEAEYQKSLMPNRLNTQFDLRWGLGLAYYVLVEQDIRLRTKGFAVEEKNVHIIQSDLYFEGTSHRLSALGLIQADYRPKDKWVVFGQVNLNAPFTLLTKDHTKMYDWGVGLKAGFRRVL